MVQTSGGLPPHLLRKVERYAAEMKAELERFDSRFLAEFADTSDWRVGFDLLESYHSGRFDLIAEWLLFLSVAPDSGFINPLYENYLSLVIEEKSLPHLLTAQRPVRDDIRDDIVSRIKLKLEAKKLHWLADANRRHANEIETQERNIKKSPDKPAKPVEGKLPPKSHDLSGMFADTKLTGRQAEIASLAWERGLSKVQIARRLGRDPKTIDESLASSQRRIDIARMKTKSAAKRAKFDPDNQG